MQYFLTLSAGADHFFLTLLLLFIDNAILVFIRVMHILSNLTCRKFNQNSNKALHGRGEQNKTKKKDPLKRNPVSVSRLM